MIPYIHPHGINLLYVLFLETETILERTNVIFAVAH